MRSQFVWSVFSFALILVGLLVLAFEVRHVEARGTVYIRADGSVDPPTAPIFSADKVTYILSGNITSDGDGIVVERDNIVVDGAGYALIGTGSGIGVDLTGRSNVTVKNLRITGFYHGVYLANSLDNVVLGNSMTGSGGWGVEFEPSSVCLNNTIVGNDIANNGGGIELNYYSRYNYVLNNSITANSWHGIVLYASTDNILSGNNITANKLFGIWLSGSSSNNTLRNNRMAGNRYNFYVGAWRLEYYLNDVDASNTVDGKPVYYWINRRDAAVPLDAGYVALINCSNITAKNLNLANNGQGLLLAHTQSSTITGNNITNNFFGIFLGDSSNNNNISYNVMANNEDSVWLDGYFNSVHHNSITNGTILLRASNNIVSHNNLTHGSIELGASGNVVSYNNLTPGDIWLVGSSNNIVRYNNIEGGLGITLDYSSNHNEVSHNNITNSEFGFVLSYSSDNNNISYNNIANNRKAVMFSFGCSNNVFHHNNFINNKWPVNIGLYPGANIWDAGYPSGGNYWSDHNPPDEDKDMIGDKPYVIDASNVDRYPLIYPYGFLPKPDVNNDGIVNIVDVATVARAFGCKPGEPRWNPTTDMDTNEAINIIDIARVAFHFGEKTP